MGYMRRPGYHSPSVVPYDEHLYMCLRGAYQLGNAISDQVLRELDAYRYKEIDLRLTALLRDRAQMAELLESKQRILERRAQDYFLQDPGSSMWKQLVIELIQTQHALTEVHSKQILDRAKFIGLILN
jgi:hypothetical protein